MIKYQTNLENIQLEDLNGFFVGWSSPLSKEQHFEALQNSQYIVLALDNDKVIGFINSISDKVAFAFIPMLEVLPEYQGAGIGTELVERMLDQIKDYQCIDLMCDPNVQPFYERFKMLKGTGMMKRSYIE